MTRIQKKLKITISACCVLILLLCVCSLGALSVSADASLPYLNIAGKTLIFDGNQTQNTVPNVTLQYDKATKVATLTLNGVNTAEQSNGYSIYASQISHLNIVLAEGSENSFSISYPNADQLAFICATCPVTISGNGWLTATVTNKDGASSYGSAPIARGIYVPNGQLLICGGASVDVTLDVGCRNGAFGIQANETVVSNAGVSVSVSNARVVSSSCLVGDVTMTAGRIALTPGTNATLGANVIGKGTVTSTQNGTTEYRLEHAWNYRVSENVLTAWCSSTTCPNCDYYGEEKAISLTLLAEDAVFATETVVTQFTIMGAPYEMKNTEAIPYANASLIKSDPAWNGFSISNISYSTESGAAPDAVGEYTASVTVNGQTITDGFAITKGVLTEDHYSEPIPIDRLIYTGEPQELITAGSVECAIEFNEAGDPFGTMVYSLDGVHYSENIPTATDAGSYTVYYKVRGDENHNDSEPKTVPAAIGKASALPVITFPSATDAVYGELLRDVALIGGSTEYGTFVWKSGDTLPTVTNDGYVVVFTPNDLTIQNYEGMTSSEQTVPLSVSKRVVTVTVDDKTVCVGEAYTPSYTVSGFVGSEGFVSEPTVTDPSAQTVGEYEITASGAVVNDNYTVVYQKGTLSVRDHAYDHDYDGNCNVCGEARTVAEHVGADGDHADDGDGTELPKDDGLSGGAIAGIVIGAVAVVGIGGFAIFQFVIKKKKTEQS